MKKINKQDRLNHEHANAEVLLSAPEMIWRWDSPAGRIRAERRGRLIMEAGAIKSDNVTLEIGCGTGVFTELVSQSGLSVAT